MTPELQQFVDQIQQQWQAAQAPLQDLWANSQYITIAVLGSLGLLLFLMFVGLIRGGFKRRAQARQLAAHETSLQNLRQENASERYRETQERAKLRKDLDQKLADAQRAANDEVTRIQSEAEASANQARETLTKSQTQAAVNLKSAETRFNEQLAASRKSGEDALLHEREVHRTEVKRLRDENQTVQEALRTAQAQSGTTDRARQLLNELKAQNERLEITLSTERAAHQNELASLRASQLGSAGSANAELIRERDNLAKQLEALLSQPVSGNIGPQLEQIEGHLNAAIELYAIRNSEGAIMALSNAAQLVGQLRRAENAAV